jgi:hypothetical protein
MRLKRSVLNRSPQRAAAAATLGIVVLLSIVTADALPAADLFTMQSAQSGKYVRAGVGSGSHLAAVSSHVMGWEIFALERLGGDRVALRSTENGKYVRAGVGPDSHLAAVSDHVRAWETFKWIRLDDRRFALQSAQSGKHVRAGVGPDSHLAAVSDHVRGWETFVFARPAAKCSISGRAVESGNRGVLRHLGVSLHDHDGRFLPGRGVRFNAGGAYSFSSLEPGWYILRVTPHGKADPLYRSEPREHTVNCVGRVTGKNFTIR